VRWTGEREGTGGEEEERRAEMGGASVSDKVRDERDAGRKRQRGGTRGKWRCGVVVGAGGRGRLCSLSCGRLRLPPASRPHPHPHPLGSSAAGGSGAFVCVRWCGGCFACCCGSSQGPRPPGQAAVSAGRPCCVPVAIGLGAAQSHRGLLDLNGESNLGACDLR